jgi:D-alanyl-D-alanine carboxypeptidase/D-alanyl-D-alanine-endopeptidase (penicillin-binding protein 4)
VVVGVRLSKKAAPVSEGTPANAGTEREPDSAMTPRSSSDLVPRPAGEVEPADPAEPGDPNDLRPGRIPPGRTTMPSTVLPVPAGPAEVERTGSGGVEPAAARTGAAGAAGASAGSAVVPRKGGLLVRQPGEDLPNADEWLRRGMAGVAVVLVLAAIGGSAASSRSEPLTPPASVAANPVNTQGLPGVNPPATTAPVTAPAPVLGDDAGTAAAPTPAGVARVLAPRLADPRLGARVGVQVLDVAAGTTLLDRGGRTPATPASTSKLLAAAALLTVRDADDRLATKLVAGAKPGQVVLVGGGDPTLSGAGPGRPTMFPDAARVIDLLARAKLSRASHITSIVVDGSLFSGAQLAPGWDPSDVDGGFAAPITGLMLDAGRLQPPADQPRSQQPDLAAGRVLAGRLGLPGTAVVRGSAPANAKVLATVESPPLARIVEQMLLRSDNVTAEVLARQVAVEERLPATFAGGAKAVAQVLARVGVDVAGVAMVDGSGLSPRDKIPPATLVSLLRTAMSVDHPALHALVPGLPVAGYDGTLDDRFGQGPSAGGAGAVRAKTGTLTGVSSLAGVVTDREGRVLVFAIMADQVPAGGTLAAEAALDEAASALAGCGCG